jgi:hypothetical protein
MATGLFVRTDRLAGRFAGGGCAQLRELSARFRRIPEQPCKASVADGRLTLLFRQEIGLGHNTDDPTVVDDRYAADPVLNQRLGDLLERGRPLDRDHGRRHEISNVRHRSHLIVTRMRAC